MVDEGVSKVRRKVSFAFDAPFRPFGKKAEKGIGIKNGY